MAFPPPEAEGLRVSAEVSRASCNDAPDYSDISHAVYGCTAVDCSLDVLNRFDGNHGMLARRVTRDA